MDYSDSVWRSQKFIIWKWIGIIRIGDLSLIKNKKIKNFEKNSRIIQSKFVQSNNSFFDSPLLQKQIIYKFCDYDSTRYFTFDSVLFWHDWQCCIRWKYNPYLYEHDRILFKIIIHYVLTIFYYEYVTLLKRSSAATRLSNYSDKK